MAKLKHPEDLVANVAEHMQPILAKSKQGIYLYLDDNHKICNKKFADMLGYESPREWANTGAPLSDILEEDQDKVIKTYTDASEKLTAGAVDVKAKNIKTEKIISLKMIIVPFAYAGHIFTAHYFSKTKNSINKAG
jgi:hypothetical protein